MCIVTHDRDNSPGKSHGIATPALLLLLDAVQRPTVIHSPFARINRVDSPDARQFPRSHNTRARESTARCQDKRKFAPQVANESTTTTTGTVMSPSPASPRCVVVLKSFTRKGVRIYAPERASTSRPSTSLRAAHLSSVVYAKQKRKRRADRRSVVRFVRLEMAVSSC